MTLSIAVAVRKVSRIFITLVGSTSEGILVCLHDVEFGASMSANFRAIAVLERVTVISGSRHDNGVKGSEAPTAALFEIDIEFN